MSASHRSWNTEKEIDFIKKLGTLSPEDSMMRARPKLELLKRYIQAADWREIWNGVDSVKCVSFANELLRQQL